jgi:hypothetical protein
MSDKGSGGKSGVGSFHQPSNPGAHPADSIGNQQIWNQGEQVGAIEYTRPSEAPGPGQDATLDVNVEGSGESSGSGGDSGSE